MKRSSSVRRMRVTRGISGGVLVAAVVVVGPLARADAPAGRYTLMTSNTEVKDNVTGLIWSRAEESGTFTWANAKTQCTNRGGGYRLPTIRELQSIVDDTVTSAPTIDKTAFLGATSGYKWSSSPYALFSGHAWNVHFSSGTTYNHPVASTYGVRCVR